ncbi:TolB family protein [Olivibacter sitiensis]|uniref:TolB family protein n=1 Tax=Olivibacter sitiensis TaxID=376470 RepID=UPI0004225E36|nr:hypothetical protein [Olivibacter sitiensis]
MKKFFLGSIALIVFALSIILFQLSCKKEAETVTSTQQQIGKILYIKSVSSRYEIWIANYDGSNPTRINYALPGDTGEIHNFDFYPQLSPDGKTVFISISGGGNVEEGIYSCNVDGTNMRKVMNSGYLRSVY